MEHQATSGQFCYRWDEQHDIKANIKYWLHNLLTWYHLNGTVTLTVETACGTYYFVTVHCMYDNSSKQYIHKAKMYSSI